MESTFLTALLADDSVGWIGWLMVTSVVVAFGIGLLTKSLLLITRNLRTLKDERVKPDYKKQVLCENDITQVLKTVRNELSADRVLVVQYHNGVHSIANNSLLKMSITHESLDKNVRSGISLIQNIPSNYFGDWNRNIFEGRYVEMPIVEDDDNAPQQRAIVQFLQTDNVKSIYLFPIEDASGQTFGIGLVQYIRRDHELTKEWLDWTKQRFSGVGALLAGTYFTEDN